MNSVLDGVCQNACAQGIKQCHASVCRFPCFSLEMPVYAPKIDIMEWY